MIVKHTKRNIPFGIGARRCLGENVARMESLLFFANVMKRFRLLKMDEILSKTMNARFGQVCQALSISQSLNLSLSLRDRDRADIRITLPPQNTTPHHRKLFKHLEVTYTQV